MTHVSALRFRQRLNALQSGQALTGKDGILTPLIKR